MPTTTTPILLLRGADVFAPAPLGRQDVLVAGGQIVAIAPHLELPPPSWHAEVLDCQGFRLIPGLIDSHVHFAGGGGEAGAATRVPPVQLTDLTLGGVTSAIGVLGTDTVTRSMADLLANARCLADLGVSTWCMTGGYTVPPQTLTGSVRGDIVHCDRIIAAGEIAVSDHRSSQPTLDELLRIAADCHVAGMMTGKAGLLHLHLGDGRRGLDLVRRALSESELPPRTFHPTHVNRQRRLWQEAKDLTRSGCTVDVTAFPADEEALSAAQAIADFLQSGLDPSRLTVSSDGGGCLPTFDGDGCLLHMDVGRSRALAETLAELLRKGMELGRILPMFTSNVATLFRLGGKGVVALGADADLVLLDAEHRPSDVLARGRWLVRHGRPVAWGLFEADRCLK